MNDSKADPGESELKTDICGKITRQNHGNLKPYVIRYTFFFSQYVIIR